MTFLISLDNEQTSFSGHIIIDDDKLIFSFESNDRQTAENNRNSFRQSFLEYLAKAPDSFDYFTHQTDSTSPLDYFDNNKIVNRQYFKLIMPEIVRANNTHHLKTLLTNFPKASWLKFISESSYTDLFSGLSNFFKNFFNPSPFTFAELSEPSCGDAFSDHQPFTRSYSMPYSFPSSSFFNSPPTMERRLQSSPAAVLGQLNDSSKVYKLK